MAQFATRIYGKSTSSLVNGTDKNDRIDTFLGNDTVYAGAGDDYIGTSNGNDIAYAGLGNDSINLGLGNDVGYGEQGNDILLGGSGNDSLFGGDGADTLSGDAGNDTIVGGLGNDQLSDGLDFAGNDVFVFNFVNTNGTIRGVDGKDTIHHFMGADKIAVVGITQQNSIDSFKYAYVDTNKDKVVDTVITIDGDTNFSITILGVKVSANVIGEYDV